MLSRSRVAALLKPQSRILVVGEMMLDESQVGWRGAEQPVARATARFGRGSVRPARLVAGPGEPDDSGFGGQPVAPRPR